ncbi:MAG TPA: M20/M25/M40 family metallo-hydrolase [Miltoncostaeaceae bacterium]|nr:M20/M25/M40 family metallo-hydrolase [Miltoncostaeaceae bacterium]
MDEVQLAERLIGYDTSQREGIAACTDFIAGWLSAQGAQVRQLTPDGRRCLIARVGRGPRRVVLHGHLDVVPGNPDQFRPRLAGDRLIGRGAYDMKAALGAMMLALADLAARPPDAEVVLIVVPDEERSEPGDNCTQLLVRDGLRADFVICGEPTDMQVGVQAKGVLMLDVHVPGIAAHGSTPWLGDNAVLRAVDVYREILRLPFAGESTALFARPSINLGRIEGGDAINRVPDRCRLHVDIRYLPGQCPDEVISQVRSVDPQTQVEIMLERPPAYVPPDHPYVAALLAAAARHEPQATPVGRDGASDAVAFLEVGVPAVEFGPRGAGHHGADEYVEVDSLPRYRRALVEFARADHPAPSANPTPSAVG